MRPSLGTIAVFCAVLMGAYNTYNAQHTNTRDGAVIVTGASSGIGRHAACHLVKLSYTVYAGVRKLSDAHSLEGECPGIHPVILDVTNKSHIDSLVQTVQAGALPLVALVNNAGLGSGRIPVEFDRPRNARKLFEVNYWGAVSMTTAFIPLMRRDATRLIFVSSIAVNLPVPGVAYYGGTKAAAEMFAFGLANELAPWRVKASIIRPGYIKSKVAINRLRDVKEVADISREQGYALYPGWFKTEVETSAWADKISRGLDPGICSQMIHSAIVARQPLRIYYAVSAIERIQLWVAWLIPHQLADLLYQRVGAYQE